MKLDDGLLFLQAELAPLDVRPQVVCPPQSAALPAPLQAWRMLVEFSLPLFIWKMVGFRFIHTHLPSQVVIASSHGRAPQCRQVASDPPLASMDLSSGQSSHSMVIAPLKQCGVLSFWIQADSWAECRGAGGYIEQDEKKARCTATTINH